MSPTCKICFRITTTQVNYTDIDHHYFKTHKKITLFLSEKSIRKLLEQLCHWFGPVRFTTVFGHTDSQHVYFLQAVKLSYCALENKTNATVIILKIKKSFENNFIDAQLFGNWIKLLSKSICILWPKAHDPRSFLGRIL